jgi:hypothetical protein
MNDLIMRMEQEYLISLWMRKSGGKCNSNYLMVVRNRERARGRDKEVARGKEEVRGPKDRKGIGR